jgi:hypothetical protein
MNREQAVEIERNLKRAANAIRRAEILIWDLDQEDEDRARLSEPLGKAIIALSIGLRGAIHRRFPELRPPSKGSRFVDSKLTWKQIQLRPPLTEAEFDGVIFATLHPQWRKVAAIVTRVVNKYEHTHPAVTCEMVAVRLRALSEADLIQSQGDLRKWRFSEVRLKG